MTFAAIINPSIEICRGLARAHGRTQYYQEGDPTGVSFVQMHGLVGIDWMVTIVWPSSRANDCAKLHMDEKDN
eukprot:scaffold1525_cov142-Cylindrotheca_fusiformis.AAC.121